ncbi:phosphotransferase [Paenibacillus lignilyticus]|uniref:Phosphotransferase n=1 Tax=Paenibacillus lignilyticus TaxID=1172615 RepID=A0ABS5C8T3_9BACL|nr:phosphotransferase [Paenibacillus lignilyticus]MBP3961528.1 phosphotransferase [Paenibacillus lignilyticus]MBP3963802.1 phosphotransferase [Paenibacillus lignilyticus]
MEAEQTASPDICKIIQELAGKHIIHPDTRLMHQVSGTTEGRVYILMADEQPRYVLKLEDAEYLSVVSQFLNDYAASPLLPKVHFTAPDNSYIVYAFVRGTTGGERGLKQDWLPRLTADLLNHYREVEQSDPSLVWDDHTLDGLDFAKNEMGSLLPEADYELVVSIAIKLLVYREARPDYWLHGDCGVHNFVYREQQLVGVIDPTPMAGPLLYDFIFAFVSSPDDLTMETLLAALELLDHEPMEREELVWEVVVGLYYRIGVCLLHHPHDLPAYLEAWNYWKALVRE